MFIQENMTKIAILLSVLICVRAETKASSAPLLAQPASTFTGSFLMTVAEDGENTLDNFEIWEVSGNFQGHGRSCSIQAASFIVSDATRVYLWNHGAKTITEVRPGIYRIEMNGRLSSFSGLEVVIEFSRDGSRIVDISGSMRSGTKGQSVRVFHVDRKT
jgi:hypothetical protein